MSRVVPRDFYDRDTLEVAHDLIGCILVHDVAAHRTSGKIVEVEAYEGEDDPACHAAAGLTARTEPLYGPPGHAYVYLIYGMHHCLNAVTRRTGLPSAVLIRAVEPVEGRPLMRRRRFGDRRRGPPGDRELANGPGKLCQALGLTLAHNRSDLTRSPLWIEEGEPAREIAWSPRVGIRVGTDRHWRAFEARSPWITRSALNRLAETGPRLGPNGDSHRRGVRPLVFDPGLSARKTR